MLLPICANNVSETLACGTGQFACTSSVTCIPIENVRDGFPNCADGEDELVTGDDTSSGFILFALLYFH